MAAQTEEPVSIVRHPQSGLDSNGRLLEGTNRLLRAISAVRAPEYERLLGSPDIAKLFSMGLVRTEIADTRVDGYPLVLEHERIEFASHWLEWPSLMLRDGALMLCELNIELLKRGFGAHDVHPWNILFDFTRPVFVDFGGLSPIREFLANCNLWAANLRSDWVLPLTLISAGHPTVARSIGRYPGVVESPDRILRRPPFKWFPLWYYWLTRSARGKPILFFKHLRARLEGIPLLSSHPADRRGSLSGSGEPHQDTPRSRAVGSLLADLKPPTVVDVGCGDGYYSLLAERMGARVVAFDAEESRINALYTHVKTNHLRVLPLIMEFTTPTAAGGRVTEFPAATTRLACDTSVMIDRLHREVFGWGIPFERVAQLLSRFTKRYSIVEFAPRQHEWVAERLSSRFEFYSMDNFVRAMASYFSLLAVLDSDPPSKLLVFRRDA